MKYGYARVSTKDQVLDLQIDALKKAGCDKIFLEVASGTKANRPEWAKLLSEIKADDTLVVWKLDRMGRSLQHLVKTVNELITNNIDIISLKDPINVITAQGRLMFNIFASLAEFEKDLIRERTMAGLKSARARGRMGGRPKGLSEKAKRCACSAEALYKQNELTSDEIAAQLAQREHSGATFNYEKLGEQGKALQQAVNQTRMLREQHNYGWDQAAKATLEASASGKIPIIGPSVSIKGEATAANTSSQSVSNERGINIENHTNHSNNNVIRASSNSSWAQENNIDTSYSDSVRRSYEEQQRLESQASISQQRVHDWHQAQSVINSQGSSTSKEMFQEVVDRISNTYGVDSTTAHQMASKRTPEAQRVWQQMQGEDHYVQNLVSNIGNQRHNITGTEAHQKLDDFSSKGQATIDHDHAHKVQQHALEQGLDTSKISKNIKDDEARLTAQHSDITEHNRIQHYSIEHANNIEAQDKRQEVNQYEKDRIGTGFITSNIAKGLGIVTDGRLGHTVGKPKKED
ncbi:Serine recombinase PinE [Pseudolycoriella hygida]|uniref:Serine recombinase PinE n=1 Tax=Pseudolycoriella hygida TaxID=35572 RepID=A0A9Q0RW37_9DIPT|nr:Serine recombinase PinE [Pseudolycoriella hygida]